MAIHHTAPLLPASVFCIIATYHGLGARDSRITKPEELELRKIVVKEYMVYFELVYFACSISTKLAMAVMIMRLGTKRKYLWTLWGTIVVLLASSMVCLGVVFASCTPFPATWNPYLGQCPLEYGWIAVSYGGSVMLAVVDWTAAIMPFFMLRELQMPKRKKLSVQLILGLGVFGSVAGLVRMPYYQFYDIKKYPHDTLYNYGHIILWSVLEGGLGVIACSLPPLRALFRKFYQGSGGRSGYGLKSNSEISRKLTNHPNKQQQQRATGGTQLSVLASPGPSRKRGSIMDNKKQWNRLDDEESSGSSESDGIMKRLDVVVPTEEAGHTGSDGERVNQRLYGDRGV
ncbi:hypothetical protein PG994_002304 [Apiospora phragmitis]|uniref:Rhodopsin domain-containing protein n=1 Tax=Apiospora phragmitis TaxID=2905665 RepID=A0ABR1WW10_9PEZI